MPRRRAVEIDGRSKYHWTSRPFDYTVGTRLLGLAQLRKGVPRYLLTNVAEVIGCDDAARTTSLLPYTFAPLAEYAKWEGRVIVDVAYAHQNGRVWATKVMDVASVHEVIPSDFEFDDEFPGYHNVDLSWRELAVIVASETPSWKTALRNQWGVYLITDTSNGKHYVGSASGADELWGRWSAYAAGHGGNAQLRSLPVEHIQKYFRFTLLETTGALTETDEVLARENHWKRVLDSRAHGYNSN